MGGGRKGGREELLGCSINLSEVYLYPPLLPPPHSFPPPSPPHSFPPPSPPHSFPPPSSPRTPAPPSPAVEVTKDDVIESNRKSTGYKSDKFTTEPSRNCESHLSPLLTGVESVL